jgi:hypothetical protein
LKGSPFEDQITPYGPRIHSAAEPQPKEF